MPKLIPVLSQKDIARAVARVASEINSDFRDQPLVVLGVLKGAFIFLSDLIRQLNLSLKVDFIWLSSYGAKTASTGEVRLLKEIGVDIRGQNVLLVEDIVDSGLTLSFLVDYLRAFDPRAVKICALIDKKERRQISIPLDYCCHVIDEGFLVGYGLDYDENYRGLPEIYHLQL